MLEKRGKEDLLASLREKGFNVDEATRAYDAVADFFKKNIVEGNSVYLRGVMKLHARKLPARVYIDNLNKKEIQFGERVSHLFRNLTA